MAPWTCWTWTWNRSRRRRCLDEMGGRVEHLGGASKSGRASGAPSPATPPAAAARRPSAVAPSFAAMASARDTTSRLAEAASRERFVTLAAVMIYYVLLSTKAGPRRKEPKGHGENMAVLVIRPC